MTTLADIFDTDLLRDLTSGGYVRVQRHPRLPLLVYNYTEKAQYESVWNPVTLACRGLIAEDGTDVVRARPFPKFFNHDQPGAPELTLDEPVTVTDKADGSLGVLYPTPDGIAVATRGSFASDQARHATAVLRSRYADFTPPAGLTVLVEIVYPDNRIVLDYQGLDDLILLGAVVIATGATYGPEAVPGWPGPAVERFSYPTLADALAAPPRDGREGLVVHLTDRDLRVKIKYAEYVRLHRLVTGLNARVIWQHLVDGADLDALAEPLPDELHGWLRGVAAELTAAVDAHAVAVEKAYAEIIAGLGDGWTRKDFALVAGRHPERGYLFMRLDERDYRPALWQRVRPVMGPTTDEDEQ